MVFRLNAPRSYQEGKFDPSLRPTPWELLLSGKSRFVSLNSLLNVAECEVCVGSKRVGAIIVEAVIEPKVFIKKSQGNLRVRLTKMVSL
jgi:hypothetical protein